MQAEQVGEDGCGQLGGEVTGTSWRPSRMNVVPPRQVPQVAGTRGHRTPLTIPAPARATGPAISQDQRWTHVARLLDDAVLDPTAAG